MKEKPVEAFPLSWPVGRPRAAHRQGDVFKVSFARARDEISREVRRLGGERLVISSNVPLRKDGLPYADFKTPENPGVAVYFAYKGKQMCFACDRWNRATANMNAIALTIGALRGVARWGTGDMMEAAFTGFAALPAPMTGQKPWRDVLGVAFDERDPGRIGECYRIQRGKTHPDRVGGDHSAFLAVQAAYEQAARELGFTL